MLIRGDSLDLIQAETGKFQLIVTDPPYAFGGSGDEHAGSGAIVRAAEAAGMDVIGYEKNPAEPIAA